jgi:ClpP class serine protease
MTRAPTCRPRWTRSDSYGEGRVYSARQALKLGMVDRVGTYDDVIARLSSSKRGSRRTEEWLPEMLADLPALETEAVRDVEVPMAQPQGTTDDVDAREGADAGAEQEAEIDARIRRWRLQEAC